jgi:hypothetical protein
MRVIYVILFWCDCFKKHILGPNANGFPLQQPGSLDWVTYLLWDEVSTLMSSLFADANANANDFFQFSTTYKRFCLLLNDLYHFAKRHKATPVKSLPPPFPTMKMNNCDSVSGTMNLQKKTKKRCKNRAPESSSRVHPNCWPFRSFVWVGECQYLGKNVSTVYQERLRNKFWS